MGKQKQQTSEPDLLYIPAFLLRKNWSKDDHERSRKACDKIMSEKRDSTWHRGHSTSAGIVQIVEMLKQGDMSLGMLEQSLMAGGFTVNSSDIQKCLRLLVRRGRVEFVNDLSVYRLVADQDDAQV